MKCKSTKETILYVLKKNGEISMKELMEHFSISEPAVRKQLNELLRIGLVHERNKKKDIGRPYHLYSLTEKGHQTFPNQYEELAMDLLNDLHATQGEEAVHSLLEAKKNREEKELKKILLGEPFKDRVYKMVSHQEDKGYIVDVQETEDGDFKIINYNCPIYHLASKYHIVCTHEKEIYDEVFSDSKVQSHQCMTEGENYCCWSITKPVK